MFLVVEVASSADNEDSEPFINLADPLSALFLLSGEAGREDESDTVTSE